jgi:hypothetical protein
MLMRPLEARHLGQAACRDTLDSSMKHWWGNRSGMKLPYWIQRADYSATDFAPVTCDVQRRPFVSLHIYI